MSVGSERNGSTPELLARIHDDAGVHEWSDSGTAAPGLGGLGVLQLRKQADGSPLAEHLARLRSTELPAAPGFWSYDPEVARRAAREDPRLRGDRFSAWTRACSECTENGIAAVYAVCHARQNPELVADPGWKSSAVARPIRVTVADDRAGEIFRLARSGANNGRTTKSLLAPCTRTEWRETAGKYGLNGVNALPNITLGTHGLGLLTQWYPGWEQDYITLLDVMFYVEYNIDILGGRENRFLRDLCAALDLPEIPEELRARRLHMSCDMAFFEAKRKTEARFSTTPTDGQTVWVFPNRDVWRDFKAADSGIWGQYLSYTEGVPGLDDMALTGLAHDWMDLGPDLRNSEYGQSVLTMTGGSIAGQDLVRCYERTVWLLNAQWNTEGEVKPERYAAAILCTGVGMWGIANHRHDMWRYFSIAADVCAEATRRDLYRSCQLADSYTEDFRPREPENAERLRIPRTNLAFSVRVQGRVHDGSLVLHDSIVNAVRDGVLPMNLVDNALVLPILLREGKIAPAEFLRSMDENYCAAGTTMIRTLHGNEFSRAVGKALAALIMEQWWHGVYYAIGVGSLIEAQPGAVAQDRAHLAS
ncbi:hypothetical protein [Sciscionella marina]|uniref:hypothetical protein n=1 Tax=Sciscionella marina TaxID=508770 RepID=UPI0003808BAD|nr:hypothetical protein [Sciscionella marina]